MLPNIKINQGNDRRGKKLVDAFGLPVIEAPTEAEAQASLITRNNDAFAGNKRC